MRDSTVNDLMQRDVLVVNPQTSLVDVHRLFVEEEINGAPVVDEADGAVVGVISSLDLLRAVREEYDHVAAIAGAYFRDELPASDPDWNDAPADFAERMGALTVADAMVRDVVSVAPDARVADVAHLMRTQRIHRVLVVTGRALVGILTTFDLLRVIDNREARVAPVAGRAAGDPIC